MGLNAIHPFHDPVQVWLHDVQILIQNAHDASSDDRVVGLAPDRTQSEEGAEDKKGHIRLARTSFGFYI